MDKKANANKLISSMVALTLATTLGVPTAALADTGDEAGSLVANSESQPVSGDVAGAYAASQQGTDESQPADNSQSQQGAAGSAQAAVPQSEGVAQVGDDTYATLQEAINKAPDNATVKLLKDTVENVVIDKTRILNLDLNGHKITNASGDTILNRGTLVIDGAGTIDNVTHGKAAVYNIGTATLKSGTYERSAEAGADSSNSGGNSFYTVLNHGTMTVEEGAIVKNKGHFSSLFENGYYSYKNADGIGNPSLTINGGTFDGGLNTIKNDDDSTLVVNGGTFKNYTQAALQNYGTATVAGGEFSAESKYAVDNCGSDAVHDPGKLTISGGTFVGELYVHGPYSDVSVSGGDFSGSITADKDRLSVTGGTFTDPGVYKYAESGTVNVNMNEDYNGSIVLRSGVTANLNLGGNTLMYDNAQALDIYGSLTLRNGYVCVKNSNPDKPIAAIWVNKSAHLVVENDATITAADESFGIGYWSDCDSAEVTVKGNVKGANGITMNGNIGAETSNKLVLDGATIKVDGHAIYQAGGADTSFTLNNSSITGGSTGIEVRAGNLSVNNCKITGGDIFRVSPNGNGTTTDGAGIAIAQHTTKQPINVVVNGGTISGKYALYESNPQNNDADAISQVKLSIAGGTFAGDVYSQDIDGFITGGTFSSKPDASYIASGYEAVGSDTYTVQRISSSTPAPAPTTETTTTTNPDGTTTTTVTDKKTGESTSTTEGANGTTVIEKTDASGNTTTKVTVPEGAATNAGAPVEIPAAVEMTKDKEVSISAPAGTIVAIPAAADAGNVAVIVHADGTETVIPMSLVEGGKAIVKLDGDETIRIVDNAKVFSDVPAEHWAADDIDFASSHEIFKGIGNGDTYEPETALTRNMMMTVLARADGADTSDSDPWYAKGQQWAVDNGVSNGLWGEDSITREQLVTMLFNYANKSGMDTSARADLSGMKNADAVSDWALEAVQWAVAEGILKGVDNTDLAPQGLATRAQAAAFMQRYVKTALL